MDGHQRFDVSTRPEGNLFAAAVWRGTEGWSFIAWTRDGPLSSWYDSAHAAGAAAQSHDEGTLNDTESTLMQLLLHEGEEIRIWSADVANGHEAELIVAVSSRTGACPSSCDVLGEAMKDLEAAERFAVEVHTTRVRPSAADRTRTQQF